MIFVRCIYYIQVSVDTKVSQKNYIKKQKFYVIHVFHYLFTKLKMDELQFIRKIKKFSTLKCEKWENFFCCHIYINLLTHSVDNCVDKAVIFALYIFWILWYNDGDI